MCAGMPQQNLIRRNVEAMFWLLLNDSDFGFNGEADFSVELKYLNKLFGKTVLFLW
jgi:hypothetical protein